MQRDWTGGVARSAGVVGDESRLTAVWNRQARQVALKPDALRRFNSTRWNGRSIADQRVGTTLNPESLILLLLGPPV
jgi:hypothetical protein